MNNLYTPFNILYKIDGNYNKWRHDYLHLLDLYVNEWEPDVDAVRYIGALYKNSKGDTSMVSLYCKEYIDSLVKKWLETNPEFDFVEFDFLFDTDSSIPVITEKEIMDGINSVVFGTPFLHEVPSGVKLRQELYNTDGSVKKWSQVEDFTDIFGHPGDDDVSLETALANFKSNFLPTDLVKIAPYSGFCV